MGLMGLEGVGFLWFVSICIGVVCILFGRLNRSGLDGLGLGFVDFSHFWFSTWDGFCKVWIFLGWIDFFSSGTCSNFSGFEFLLKRAHLDVSNLRVMVKRVLKKDVSRKRLSEESAYEGLRGNEKYQLTEFFFLWFLQIVAAPRHHLAKWWFWIWRCNVCGLMPF